MKIEIIKSNERGRTKLDWLDSYHSFSFGEYYNPKRTNFGKLIVFNDDIIQGGKGFGMHPHENAEVISIPIMGALKHKDSRGNEEVIEEGKIQRMSAGTGIVHSEFNASADEKAHFLQIWLTPNKLDVMPSYESRNFEDLLEKNKFIKIVSGNKKDKVIHINQDASISICDIEKGKDVEYNIGRGRGLYLFVISGNVNVGDNLLINGDSAEITGFGEIKIRGVESARVLGVDVRV